MLCILGEGLMLQEVCFPFIWHMDWLPPVLHEDEFRQEPPPAKLLICVRDLDRSRRRGRSDCMGFARRRRGSDRREH
nr:uncharacterized protein LOC127327869 isoform X2 [Lolium perenne]